MRPERRFKPGMDGGLTAAVLISPPHHLRTAEILSKRWGPPQGACSRVVELSDFTNGWIFGELQPDGFVKNNDSAFGQKIFTSRKLRQKR
jgi:hypothetical protein